MLAKTSRLAGTIFLSYLAVALLQTWPLALHLSTHLTGQPGGDGGVYVWNTWVFRHELVELGHSPLSTSTILALAGHTNLGLHNYTVFADLLTLPLQPWLGVIASFNLVYVLNVALSGFGMYLLARHLTMPVAESWLAGLIFAWSPFLVARGASHFSLAAAAPIPFFVYWCDRALATSRARDAAIAGVMLAWAAFSDPYYAIYCVMLGAAVLVSRLRAISPARAPAGAALVRRLIDITLVVLAGLMAVVYGAASGSMRIGPVSVTMRTLYTPMLICAMLAAVRLALTMPVRISWPSLPALLRSTRTIAVLGIAGAIVLAPELQALARLAADGAFSRAPVLWRSSAPGVDLISFLLPNPNHPLAPQAIGRFLAAQPGGFDENVMSISWVGVGLMLAAWRWAAFRARRLWAAITLGFASLALGPFVSIAGIQTFFPTPWALLRYIPVVGDARMPQRFGVVVIMGLAVLAAAALAALGRRYPKRRRLILATAGIALAFELWPAPRTLYSAAVPSIYRTIAADPRPVSVLELPFGIRDGLSSFGDFSAKSQFFQATHHKVLFGGYLSRVESRTKDRYLQQPFLSVLMTYSEGLTPDAGAVALAEADASRFAADANLGYVVIDTGRVSPALYQFTVESLGLSRVARSGPLELHRPAPTH